MHSRSRRCPIRAGIAALAGTGMILTSDGQTYDAEAVGYDSTHDVAVLQLENASGVDDRQDRHLG
jgi:S1-C subfamily serine protease